MPNYRTPGVYVEEVATGARPIEAVGTSTAGFVGKAPNARVRRHEAVAVNNWSEFRREFVREGSTSTPLSHAVYGFFQNGGRRCYVVNIGADDALTSGEKRQGLDLLEEVDEVAIVAAPGFTDAAAYESLLAHCEKMKDRVAVLDAPLDVEEVDRLTDVATSTADGDGDGDGSSGEGLRPRVSEQGFAAYYFPGITVRDPLGDDELVNVHPSGHVAGVWARNDAERGVHKAPANEPIRGALNVTYRVTRDEQGILNENGVNCIRLFPRKGITIWGARTVAESASEWRYLPVRRLFSMVEESIAEATRWVVFEPNDEALWKAIRRDVSAFLRQLWRDGALMGSTPEEAFFVKCDEETNPPEVVDAGRVVTVVGLAPVKPAEFIVFRIGQHAGGTEIETA